MTDRPDMDAIRLTSEDNVATVLRPVEMGERLRIRAGPEFFVLEVRAAVPFCHKVSLVAIAAGAPIVKYGQPIGHASSAIPSGTHVHVHNLRSARARVET